jgi:hypothetical protein
LKILKDDPQINQKIVLEWPKDSLGYDGTIDTLQFLCSNFWRIDHLVKGKGSNELKFGFPLEFKLADSKLPPISPARIVIDPPQITNTAALSLGKLRMRNTEHQAVFAISWKCPAARSHGCCGDAGFPGNAGRGILEGPGLVGLDTSLFKTAAISERLKAEFRAEFFNVINHANFGPVGNAILSSARAYAPGAGAILTTATDQRELEFGLKMLW